MLILKNNSESNLLIDDKKTPDGYSQLPSNTFGNSSNNGLNSLNKQNNKKISISSLIPKLDLNSLTV
jgi:hypothetical protein